MWGRGLRGINATCSALSWLSVTSPATHKQVGPFRSWFLGGWVCVWSRILWVSPTNSPVRLGVSPAAATPTGFYSQRFWGYLFLHWNTGLHGLSCSPVVPPSLSARECGTARSTSHYLAPSLLPCHASSLPQLPVSAAPTSLNECFFFNSLVVELPYRLIVWQFWLVFVFKFVVVLLLVVRGSKVYLPTPPSWPEVE